LDCRINLYHTFCPLCTNPWSHHAFKHSSASIRPSPRAFLSGVMSFLALLKSLSHSQEVAGRDGVSNVHYRTLGKSFGQLRGIVFHESIEQACLDSGYLLVLLVLNCAQLGCRCLSHCSKRRRNRERTPLDGMKASRASIVTIFRCGSR
jgi:predicted amidophosphoribosyltransferase